MPTAAEALEGKVHTMIRGVALSFSRTYFVDKQDIEQHLVEMFLIRYPKLVGYLDDEDVARGRAYFLRSMMNFATVFCRRERASEIVQNPEDLFLYTKSHIKGLLPFVNTMERWAGLESHGDRAAGSNKADPATGGNTLAAYGDLRRAWAKLEDEDREILGNRFHSTGEIPYSMIAEDMGLDEVIIRKRVERAVGRMQRLMGGVPRQMRRNRVDPDRRKVRTNAHANSILRNQWGG